MKRILIASLLLLGFETGSAQGEGVRLSEQTIVIPTYAAGDPEPNPMFYFGRASQGAEGRVYPYPLYDTLTHTKKERTYKILYLENEHVRVGILPEIGGRLFEGVDKSNNYPFIYRQHVIKPALIGLIGAWISGGIEWNIPHHHRATTFIPVQYDIERDADGSVTVWVGELELRHRMRWAVGYTLHPGRSYLTAKVRILNRTPVSNSMLCFANVAVHANENYQVIFPPGTQYVTHHHKREFAAWPVANGRYGGADFSPGGDVSWYKNHAEANSMFAWNYTDDFFAGYDHGEQAGTMSVADHHIVPGKKLWTWGNGPRGRMWDQILTDDDGPYIELMVGAYSDNQPDYSWLQPFETRYFEMHWYPFRDIGGVKNANLEAAVNLEAGDGMAKIGFCTTKAHPAATVTLRAGDKILLEESTAIGPASPFVRQVPLPAGVDAHILRASISVNGRELIAYSPVRVEPETIPDAVREPPEPAQIQSVEELYLTGLRIEQFHHPTLDPEPYWEEALRRDPGDARVNTALGARLLKNARSAEAEGRLRKAVQRLTTRYTAPKDAEPSYYLGEALRAQEKDDEAFAVLYKATWSAEWRGPAYYSLAEMATLRGDLDAALEYADRSLEANARSLRALGLKAAVLRHLGRPKEALALLDEAVRKTDPLDVRLMAERWLAGDESTAGRMAATIRDHPHTGLETAAEYGNAGLWRDGAAVLSQMVRAGAERVSPMAYYFLGHFAERLGERAKAAEYRRLASEASPDYVFPFQWEAIRVLERAIESNPLDSRAPYYLGNLLFDWQPEKAVRLWEKSAELNPVFPIVQRNLALAYSRRGRSDSLESAITRLERAIASPVKYPLHFSELDELYEAAGEPPEKRLALLEENRDVVARRDDALSRLIGLKVFAGKPEEAIRLMAGRRFSVWEGGTLEVAEHWVDANLQNGHRNMAARRFRPALGDYQAAGAVPANLPSERRGARGRSAEVAYWVGVAHEALGETEKARQSWGESASVPPPRPRGEPPGGISEEHIQRYYRALAARKLGQEADAARTLQDLVETSRRALQAASEPGAAPESLADRRARKARMALARFVGGLGHLGLGETEKATDEFSRTLQLRPDHLGAKTALAGSK